eukprot:Skav204151  [mRNA]  locus=scaffold903:173810:176221:+ [translate_table: standard]
MALRRQERSELRSQLWHYRWSPSSRHWRNETDEARERVKRFGPETFIWNRRPCYGTKLHLASLDGNIRSVEDLLDQGVALDQEFAYLTISPGGSELICAGQSIHLAASRGHIHLVDVLLNRAADITSTVKRDGMPNYDVLQAAVFMEGRGGACYGSGLLISTLCDRGADVLRSKNAHGLSCLHVAFATGDLKTIRVVEELAAELLGLGDLEDVDFNDPFRTTHDKTPLEIGINHRNMDKDELAEAAPKCLGSLRTFIYCLPECIPTFMDALKREDEYSQLVQEVVEKISINDIVKLLRDFPKGAAILFKTATGRPKVVSQTWNPMPTWVSFASRHAVVRAMKRVFSFVGGHEIFYCYEEANCWDFDDLSWQAPEWQTQIAQTRESPFSKANIQLCYIPNIISPTFFSALLDAAQRSQPEPVFFLFRCVPIRAAVNYTFWNFAIWADLVQFLVSVWGLGLLMIETYRAHEESTTTEDLRENINRVFAPSFVAEVNGGGAVADWLIAKGIVDLSLEVAQFRGCVIINEPNSFLRGGNVWDLGRSILPIMLLFFYCSRLLQTLVVFIYWMRLFEGVTFSEWIGHALVPLQGLASGIMPALIFTLVGFCTLSHAHYTVGANPKPLWPETLFDSFTALITQGLPPTAPADPLELALLYAGVLFFSILVMNIFIGIIGEQYSKQKEQVDHLFHTLRTSSCWTYLLRVCVIPCNLVTSTSAAIIAVCSITMTFGLQYLSLVSSWQLPGFLQFFAFFICQLVTFMASIQCRGPDYPWVNFSGQREESIRSS